VFFQLKTKQTRGEPQLNELWLEEKKKKPQLISEQHLQKDKKIRLLILLQEITTEMIRKKVKK